MRFAFVALTRNIFSLIGVVLTTTSALLILTLFGLSLVGMEGSPYLGILAFLILPAVFVVGLILIPLGLRRHRKRQAQIATTGVSEPELPVIDLNRETTRRVVLTVFLLTAVNLVIIVLATFKGVEVMESNSFCGETCHSVMQPEYTVYKKSPHARVDCVDCHIGPGADWFVKSKLSGAWQLVSTALDLYPRPIPTPVHSLRPSRETCEQCHWPEQFQGDELRVVTRYSDDELNTELKTVLLLRVGGVQPGGAKGIHWHVDPNIQIRYRSDPSRETIYDVELTQNGTTSTFAGPSGAPEDQELEWRTMDCVDCHNRPTHIYGLAGSEVDAALEHAQIDRSLPFVREQAVLALEQEYASHDEARQGISRQITAYYRDTYPDLATEYADEIAAAGKVLGDIYSSNVFPQMKVAWGTYPDHIGHETSDGCYRCHNDEHSTADGKVISQDCDTCHAILAWDEESPDILGTIEASS